MLDYPPFPGFREEAFDFLRDLAANNEREWFKPRKETYEDEVVWPFRCLVADASREAQLRDLPFGADPKDALFRIYRDTRFSKNKNPYKTHAGALLSKAGAREPHGGGLYVHVEPGKSFMAAGFWRPETAVLRRWRTRMAAAPEAFLQIVRALHAAGLKVETEDALKRMPRGVDADPESPIAPYLKWKSFLASREVSDEALMDPGFTQEVVEMMEHVRPFMEYGWEIAKPSRG